MSPWWEHLIVYIGAFVFVLVWLVKNIDYDNFLKWRNITRSNGENWRKRWIFALLLLVGIAAYAIYWTIIKSVDKITP